MRKRWRVSACTAALFVFTCSGAQAQDRNQDRYYQNRGYQQDRGYDQNRDQYGNDRHRQNHFRFEDRDRQAAHGWYNQHRDRPGFRDRDRLAPEYESWLQEGYRLDWGMRRMARPIPYDLMRRLPPPPPGYRYVVIGGHIVMVDSWSRVHDVIHPELNL